MMRCTERAGMLELGCMPFNRVLRSVDCIIRVSCWRYLDVWILMGRGYWIGTSSWQAFKLLLLQILVREFSFSLRWSMKTVVAPTASTKSKKFVFWPSKPKPRLHNTTKTATQFWTSSRTPQSPKQRTFSTCSTTTPTPTFPWKSSSTTYSMEMKKLKELCDNSAAWSETTESMRTL